MLGAAEDAECIAGCFELLCRVVLLDSHDSTLPHMEVESSERVLIFAHNEMEKLQLVS